MCSAASFFWIRSRDRSRSHWSPLADALRRVLQYGLFDTPRGSCSGTPVFRNAPGQAVVTLVAYVQSMCSVFPGDEGPNVQRFRRSRIPFSASLKLITMLHVAPFLICHTLLVVMADDSTSRCEDWTCEEGYTNLEGDCLFVEGRRLASSSSSLGVCSDSTCCAGEGDRRALLAKPLLVRHIVAWPHLRCKNAGAGRWRRSCSLNRRVNIISRQMVVAIERQAFADSSDRVRVRVEVATSRSSWPAMHATWRVGQCSRKGREPSSSCVSASSYLICSACVSGYIAELSSSIPLLAS